MSDEEHLREQSVQSLYLDEKGREKPNPTPLAPPIGYVKHKTIAQQMREMIQLASYEAAMAGAETEEEANDFDVGEDFDPTSPWEHEFEKDPDAEALLALMSRPPAPAAGGTPGEAPSSPGVPPADPKAA